MALRRVTSCVASALMVTVLGICGENVMTNEKEYVLRVPDFRSQPAEKVDRAVEQVVATHHQMVSDVNRQLREGNLSDEAKVYAIYLLGQLRARESVTILIENIDLKASKVDTKGGIGRWGMYPAQEALSKIGKPAVNMILDLLPTEQSDLRRQLMCLVIADVEGKNFGTMLVKLRQDEESDSSKKANLELALRVLSGF